MEVFCNRKRKHSFLGYKSKEAFGKSILNQEIAA
jgi:hypothetical protein